MESASYTPVNCSFYDQLEHFATRRMSIDIRFRDAEGKEKAVTTRIVDFRTRDHEEWAQLEDGSEIRLDHMISAGGILQADFPPACGI